MKLSNKNICNLRGCQMPLGGVQIIAHPPHPPGKSVPELANYVFKFGNWARTSQQSSQVCFSVWTLFFINNLFITVQSNALYMFIFCYSIIQFTLGVSRMISWKSEVYSTLRNSGSSDGIVNIKVYYSGCIVQKNFNFDPWYPK
jgi:hypothetical protein